MGSAALRVVVEGAPTGTAPLVLWPGDHLVLVVPEDTTDLMGLRDQLAADPVLAGRVTVVVGHVAVATREAVPVHD